MVQFKEVGIGKLLAQLVRHASAAVQHVALHAIDHLTVLSCEYTDLLEISATDAVPMVISIAQSGSYTNKLLAVSIISGLSFYDAERLQSAIPTLVHLLGHPKARMKDEAGEALFVLMSAGPDACMEAFKHGCVPVLIENLRCYSCQPQPLIRCLGILARQGVGRQVALQRGILPLLRQRLEEETSGFMAECILDLLRAYGDHVPQSLA